MDPVKEPNKLPLIDNGDEDSRKPTEGEKKRRSSRNVARPATYAEESDDSRNDDSGDEKPHLLMNPSKCNETCVTNYDPTKLTICAKFIEISQIFKHKKVSSETNELAGISWKMNMQQFWDNGLKFSLQAENKKVHPDWFCPVAADLHIYCPHAKAMVEKTTRKLIFDGEVSTASIGFLTRQHLFDKEKGYVMEDDSLIAAVTFKVYPKTLKKANEITLREKFTEISTLTMVEVHSEPTVVDGITWKMSMDKDRLGQFSFNLYGENKNKKKWWSPVIAELRLLSHKTEEIVHIAKEKHIYEAGHEFKCLVSMLKEDLFDDKKGFVLDDSIFVEIFIKAFPLN